MTITGIVLLIVSGLYAISLGGYGETVGCLTAIVLIVVSLLLIFVPITSNKNRTIEVGHTEVKINEDKYPDVRAVFPRKVQGDIVMIYKKDDEVKYVGLIPRTPDHLKISAMIYSTLFNKPDNSTKGITPLGH